MEYINGKGVDRMEMSLIISGAGIEFGRYENSRKGIEKSIGFSYLKRLKDFLQGTDYAGLAHDFNRQPTFLEALRDTGLIPEETMKEIVELRAIRKKEDLDHAVLNNESIAGKIKELMQPILADLEIIANSDSELFSHTSSQISDERIDQLRRFICNFSNAYRKEEWRYSRY